MADPPDWGFDLPPEARWLLGYGLSTSSDPPFAPLDADTWDQLRSASRAHRLDGHLVAAVVAGDLPTTTDQRADAAALEIELTRMRGRYDDVCQPVLDALVTAEIPFRLIKGSALPWSDFPDPQLRPTADLDLLVPGANLAQAVELLSGLGANEVNPEPTSGFARQVFKGLTVAMPSGLEVDLHRILSWGPLGVRVPEADLWAPGRTFDRLGRPATTLDVERTLIHVSAHLLLLGAIRASEVRDVAQLATSPNLDPERAIAIAHRWGHASILAVALRMAEREVGLTADAHPLTAWAAGYRLSARDRAWLRIDRPDAPIHGVESAAVFLELRGIKPRITMLRATVAPRPGTDPTLGSRVREIWRTITSRPRPR